MASWWRVQRQGKLRRRGLVETGKRAGAPGESVLGSLGPAEPIPDASTEAARPVGSGDTGTRRARRAYGVFVVGFAGAVGALLVPTSGAALESAGAPAVAQAAKTGLTAVPKQLCYRVAATTGSDRNSGRAASPFRTVQRLVDSLAAGKTGCLRGGTYADDGLTIRVAGARLTSYPGERATILGRVRVTGNQVVVYRLTLDGRNSANLPSPTINADDVVFRNNDVSNRGGSSCFILGSTREIQRPLVTRNRIHDCGESNVYDHGIYMQNTDSARISGNTIYDNASRGVKVGPDADRSLIRGNVIEGNAIGLTFSGSDERVSSDNVVEHNVIAYSTDWWNVQTYWRGGFVGDDNVLRNNCVYAANHDPRYNSNGGINSGRGFTAIDNLVAEPAFVDREAKDLRLGADSQCLLVFPPPPTP